MVLQGDTLVCDKQRLIEYQTDPLYDYHRDLATPDFNLFEWLNRWLGRILESIFGSRFADLYTEPILIGIFILAILLIIWFLYRKRPELFMRTPKKTFSYDVQEDTIYGVDFASEIAAALARGDYKEAVRLLYLQTLKELSDKEIIDWQLHKTSTEYIYEVKPDKGREPFRELTNRFLRVRYGNFEASEAIFNEMKTFQKEIGRGGNDEK